MKSKADLHIKLDKEIKDGLKNKNLNLSEIFNEIGSEVLKRYDEDGYKYQKVREYIELKEKMKKELSKLESEFRDEFEEDIEEYMDNGIVDKVMNEKEDEREEMIDKFIENNRELLERRFSEYSGEVDYIHEANQIFDELLSSYAFSGKPKEFLKEVHEKFEEDEP